MRHGILAGITWALETVVLGIALSMAPFLRSEQVVFLAPFIATFLHDACSSLFMLIYHGIRRQIKGILPVLRSRNFKFLVLASAIGGPMGMTGYVLAVKYMGSSMGAVASAVYPAIGTVLAFLFLKEKVRWYQWIFLTAALLGVYGLSYSPDLHLENFWLGLLGAAMCAFGWGIEAVILAKCLKDPIITNEYALWVRQTTSALIYGLILLPILGGWGVTAGLFAAGNVRLFGTVALAALSATVSYLFYYKAIAGVGASKAMALNITYTAWAIVFTVLFTGDTGVLNPMTLLCAGVVVVCGIFAATDLQKLFGKRSAHENQ